MSTKSEKIIAATAGVLMTLPSVVMAQATIEVSGDFTHRCYLTTFEGNGFGHPVGAIGNEEMTFTFDDTWLTASSTPYSDNPSPPTMNVLWADNHGEVAFSKPVSKVSLYYLTIYEDVTLTAYDINGDVISQSTSSVTPVTNVIAASM